MKNIIILTKLIFLVAALMVAGCETAPHSTVNDPACDQITDKYTADRIEIMPLTEIVMDRQTGSLTKIETYISLLDAFGNQIKSPAIFRFELYEYLQRSAQQKGRRLYHWQPDLDLNDPQKKQRILEGFPKSIPFRPSHKRTPAAKTDIAGHMHHPGRQKDIRRIPSLITPQYCPADQFTKIYRPKPHLKLKKCFIFEPRGHKIVKK